MQRLITIVLFCLILSLPLIASEFRFAPFDIPGARLTRPFGVNDSGEIVGLYMDANNVGHGFLIDVRDLPLGRYTQIDVPGATFTKASNINARGDILGRWTASDGYNHAYLRTPDGQFTLFDPPAPCVVTKSQTDPHGTNDIGDIVGRCFDSSGKELGFLWRHDGSFKILDYPGSRTTDAWTLNNRGQIGGDYSDASGFVHGYTWTEGGGFVTFDIPGAPTSVRAINERGDIAGVYGNVSRSRVFGFLLPKRGQAFITVDYPGSINLGAPRVGNLFINNSGLIAAGYIDVNGTEHGLAAIECPPSGCR